MIDLRGHKPRFSWKIHVFPIYLLGNMHKCVLELIRTGLVFPRRLIWGVTCLSLLWNMNGFPSISLESPEMCIETLRTGRVFMRQSIWGVPCLGLLEKFMFSHLSPWKPHKCLLKPSEQGSFFSSQSIWGVTWPRFSWKNERFSIYLLGNCINGCWNSQNILVFPRQSIWGVTCLGLL